MCPYGVQITAQTLALVLVLYWYCSNLLFKSVAANRIDVIDIPDACSVLRLNTDYCWLLFSARSAQLSASRLHLRGHLQ